MRAIRRFTLVALGVLLLGVGALAYFEFDQQSDNARDDLNYYYTITGGLFPTGLVPNGDNGSGGTFRFILDAPEWGRPIDVWTRDDWFPENAGLALTLMNDGEVVYDNNGIEDGTGAWFYDASAAAGPTPGLYRAYCMSNNWDWIYATYFMLEEETTFDTLVGYFDPNGTGDVPVPFDPLSPEISYRMNIWSSVQDPAIPTRYMPAVASFTGDVFTTDGIEAAFSVSDTGIERIFPVSWGWPNDPIWRLTYKLAQPITISAGVYFFSHDAIIVTPVDLDVKPGNYPNPINLKKKGIVPVAVMCTEEFDPANIDISTVLLAGASPVKWHSEDLNKDGCDDLVLHFNTPDLIIDEDTTTVDLVGFTYDGEPIKGTDTVKVTPQGNKNK